MSGVLSSYSTRAGQYLERALTAGLSVIHVAAVSLQMSNVAVMMLFLFVMNAGCT